MRATLPPSKFGPRHPDFTDVSEVETAILTSVGGLQKLDYAVGSLLRSAIDDVIDTPSTGRCDYEELEKTEKTYLGTRVEIKLRALLGFPKGRLDLVICNRDVDIKFTIAGNWMIPSEALDSICILVAADEERAKCYFGLIKARMGYLSASTNKDGKRSVSAEGLANIRWLIPGSPYPQNFWRNVAADDRAAIFSAPSGTARIAKLFELVRRVPIHRSVVEDVARQKDYMKRLRKNGGARDLLEGKGVTLLGGKYDAKEIASRGLPACDADTFISD